MVNEINESITIILMMESRYYWDNKQTWDQGRTLHPSLQVRHQWGGPPFQHPLLRLPHPFPSAFSILPPARLHPLCLFLSLPHSTLPFIWVKRRQDPRRKLPAQQPAKKHRPLKGEGRPLSPAAASAPHHGCGDRGPSACFTPSGEEMAPASKGDRTGAANSPRSSAARNLAL